MPSIRNLIDVWNNLGTAFTALKMNVTDTASAAASKLMDLQIGGSSRFSVGKAGDFTSYRGWKNAASRAALVAAGSPTDTGLHFDGVRAYRGSSGATAFSDLSDALPAFDVRFSHWGPAGDGSTDDKARFVSAVSDVWERPLFIDPEKTYRIAHTPSSPITVADGAHIIGGYNAVLQFAASGSGTTTFLSGAADLTLENVKITVSHATADQTAVVARGADRQRFLFGDFDGGSVSDGEATPAETHIVHFLNISDDDSGDVLFLGNKFEQFSRVILKTNPATTDHTNYKFIGNTFRDFVNEIVPFNSPNGGAYGVQMIGNFAQNNIGDDLGNSSHSFGGAGVENMVLMGNVGRGKGDEIAHAEDGAKWVPMIGNSQRSTNARAGIQLTDYNASGTWRPAEKVAILGNTVSRSTRSGGIAGIDFVFGTTGEKPATHSLVIGNTADGWERGGRYGLNGQTNLWTGNIFADNDTGLQVAHPSLATHGNMLVDNDAPLSFKTSGGIGLQYYGSTTAWDGSSVFIPDAAVDTGQVGYDLGCARTAVALTIAGAATNYPLFQLGNALHGWITVFAGRADNVYRHVTAWIEWDGTQLDVTEHANVGSGITFVDFRDDGSGNLAIRLNSGSAQTNCHFQVQFNGIRTYE